MELIDEYKQLITELENKQKTISEQVLIAQKKSNKSEKLFNKKMISENEYSQDKLSLLKQKSLFNDTKINGHLYQLKLSELKQNSIENRIAHNEVIAKKEEDIVEKSLLLLSKIKTWKKDHLVVAKISGKISFSQDWKKNSVINKDTTLLLIIPNSQKMGAWMKVSGFGVGKIQTGQTVQIELDNYPAAEFGTITAKVNSINMIPSHDGYLVKLAIPENMISSYGKDFDGIPYLKGNGKIITQNRRLLTRFTDKIWYSIEKVLR
jgi:multidrug resistance efflux pump